MVAQKITFRSPFPNYEIVLRTARITHNHDGVANVDDGDRVRFVRGYLAVGEDETARLAGIRKSRFYGVDFFEDGPVAVSAPKVDDEKEALIRKVAELEARLSGKDEFDGLTGLPRLNALKKRAAELGITPQEGWKAKDYEDAVRGGAQ